MGLCPPRVMNVLLWTEAAPTWKLCSLVWGRVGPEGALFFLMYTKTSHKLALNLLSNALDTTSSRDSNNQSLLLKTETRSGLDGSLSVLCIISQLTASQVFPEYLQHPTSDGPDSVKPGKWVSSSLSKLNQLLCLNEKFTVASLCLFPGKTTSLILWSDGRFPLGFVIT